MTPAQNRRGYVFGVVCYNAVYNPVNGKVCINTFDTPQPTLYWYTREELQREIRAAYDGRKTIYESALREFPSPPAPLPLGEGRKLKERKQ